MPELSSTELLIFALCAVVLGMYLLVKGGNWTVDSAIYIARHLGVSPIVVGFTIVAFGTSFPELLASLAANLRGAPGITIGNVLGSNVANIFMVAGVTAIFVPLAAHPKLLIRDIIIMLVSTAILSYLMLGEIIGKVEGGALFGLLIVYSLWKYKNAKSGNAIIEEVEQPEFKNFKTSLLFLLLGLAVISLGADLLIRGGVLTANILGVPDLIIGLSMIAIGTSLPELSTCIAAARKKHTDVVLGNIIGSNIFNILMIIGVCAFVKPISMGDIDPRAFQIDLWITVGVTVLFSLWILIFRKINRTTGFVFVGLYALYILLQYQSLLM